MRKIRKCDLGSSPPRYLGVCTFVVTAPLEISDGLALISFGTLKTFVSILLVGIFKPY